MAMDEYISRKMKNFAADCIARIKNETSIVDQLKSARRDGNQEWIRNIDSAVWYFALGYIHGRICERWHTINPTMFADMVVEMWEKE